MLKNLKYFYIQEVFQVFNWYIPIWCYETYLPGNDLRIPSSWKTDKKCTSEYVGLNIRAHECPEGISCTLNYAVPGVIWWCYGQIPSKRPVLEAHLGPFQSIYDLFDAKES